MCFLWRVRADRLVDATEQVSLVSVLFARADWLRGGLPQQSRGNVTGEDVVNSDTV